MAVLEKIRGMGIFISVIIGLALLSFILDPNTLQTATSRFSSKYDVGRMNGKSITYQNYAQKVDHFASILGSTNANEQEVEMIQQLAWQDYMDDYVLFPAIKNAGIKLGDEELFDLTQGKEISPVLQREQVFLDENGLFSRAKLIQFVQTMGSDPSGRYALYWQFLESRIYQTQLYTKYFSLLENSNMLNTIELRRSMAENNITSDVRFILKPVSFATDTTIVVTAHEVKEYYEKNKSRFEQNASRDIEYVQFTIVPSLADIDRAERDFARFYDEFTTTDNLRAFLARNSDKPYDPRYYQAGELSSISPVLDSFAFAAKVTDVMPITREGETFFSARLSSIKSFPDSAFVQHILLPPSDVARADSIVDVLKKGGNFSALATQFSLVPGNNPDKPGELGWMTSQMFSNELDTCLTAPLNIPFKYVSKYGVHIFKVTQKTKSLKKVQVAIYEKAAIAGKETFQTYYNYANDLVIKSNNKSALFTQTASENSWPIFPAWGIAEGAKTVANISNARELTRWVYENKTKIGDVSPIISIDNKYFIVATLTAIKEKGTAPLNAKRFEIESELRREKEVKKMADELRPFMAQASDIEELSEMVGLPVSRQTGIAFGSSAAQQLDPKFIGAVTGAREGTLAGPVEGVIGVYVFTVDDRQAGAFYTEEDAKRQQQQITNQQNQIAAYVLSKAAKVEDNRAKFF